MKTKIAAALAAAAFMALTPAAVVTAPTAAADENCWVYDKTPSLRDACLERNRKASVERSTYTIEPSRSSLLHDLTPYAGGIFILVAIGAATAWDWHRKKARPAPLAGHFPQQPVQHAHVYITDDPAIQPDPNGPTVVIGGQAPPQAPEYRPSPFASEQPTGPAPQPEPRPTSPPTDTDPFADLF